MTQPHIKELQDKLSAAPDNRDLLVELGIAYAENQQYKEALATFEKALKLYPEDAVIHYDLGFLYKLMALRDLEKLELWEDATDDELLVENAMYYFRKALELNPDYVSAMNNLAALHAIREEFDDAIRLWRQSLEIDEDQPDVKTDLQAVIDRLE